MTPPLNATFIHRQTLADRCASPTAELGEIEAGSPTPRARARPRTGDIRDKLCNMAIEAGDDLRAAAPAFATLESRPP